jgi:4'-phosphopantetheinyl transferase
MNVYWFEQTEANVPCGNDWLSAGEANLLHAMRFPKRRTDWLLGRWTAKNAVALCLGLPTKSHALREIEIRAATSGAPEVFIRDEPTAVTISLSHRAGVGACAVTSSPSALGCDLEMIEPHSDAFAADYFSAEEQALVAGTPVEEQAGLLSLLWSAKESALKAMREGLRLDTSRVIVNPGDSPRTSGGGRAPFLQRSFCFAGPSSHSEDWNPLQARTLRGEVFHGWWSQSGGLLRTLVATPPPGTPILLAHDHLFVQQ